MMRPKNKTTKELQRKSSLSKPKSEVISSANKGAFVGTEGGFIQRKSDELIKSSQKVNGAFIQGSFHNGLHEANSRGDQDTISKRSEYELPIQAKLSIGKSNDPQEKEADLKADIIQKDFRQKNSEVRGGDNNLSTSVANQSQIHAKRSKQRKPKNEGKGGFEHQLKSEVHSGQQLPGPIRARMEPAFGADFSKIRIHKNEASAGLNEAINADAFTFKNHLFFGAGKYNPSSKEGEHLLLHELTHAFDHQKAVPAKDGEKQSAPKEAPAEQEMSKEEDLGIVSPSTYLPDFVVKPTEGGDEETPNPPPKPANGEETEAQEELPATPTTPESDEAFQDTLKHIKRTKVQQKKHQQASEKLSSVKRAAHLPISRQKTRNDQSAHLGKMDNATLESKKAKEELSPESFKAELQKHLAKIEKELPQSESAAKRFKKKKPINQLKKDVNNFVHGEKNKVAGPLEKETLQQSPPDSQGATQEPISQIEEPPGKKPRPIKSKSAIPKPKTAAEISMEKESQSIDNYMKDNGITESQLENSNEPDFLKALDSKRTAQKRAAEAPGEYKDKEKALLEKAQYKARKDGGANFGEMHATRKDAFGNVFGKQDSTEKTDTGKQSDFQIYLDVSYKETKRRVNGILEGLTNKVESSFASQVEMAKNTFESNVEDQLDEIYGWTVIDDWLFGEDTEAIEKVFVKEKARFVSTMNQVLNDLAILIANRLNEAIKVINDNRKAAQDKYDSLDTEQQRLADEAMELFNDRFDELESTVRDKEKELAESLARSYKKNVDSLRESFDSIKEEVSKGWIGGAIAAIEKVIKVIKQIVTTLSELLMAVIHAIKAIISDPVGFLKNLIFGIKLGIQNFMANIMKHLTGGLIKWLTGSLGPMGITIPDNLFSLKGIFNLVLQILGLTKEYFRAKAVQLLGEPIVNAIEKGVEIFKIIRKDGIKGLWNHIKQQFNDLKEMVLDSIKEMLISKVIDAGIKWILGLLSPAGAFVKAAMMIIDIVKFFMEKGSQIIALVKAFTNAISSIAAGKIDKVATAIENALARAIPVIIGFLASLLGVTGLTEKIQSIIRRIRKRIDKAITKMIMKAKKMGKAILAKLGIGKKGAKEKPKGSAKLDDVEVGEIVTFNADDEQHRLWIDTKSGVKVMIRSTPMTLTEKLADWDKKINKLDEEDQQKAKILLSTAKSQYQDTLAKGKTAKTEMDQADKKDASEKDIKEAQKADDAVENEQQELKVTLKKLFDLFGEENQNLVDGWLLVPNMLGDLKNLEITEPGGREGQKTLGYKAKKLDSSSKYDGFIVGQSQKQNNFIRQRQEQQDYTLQFDKLKGLGVEDRRKLIGSTTTHTDFKPHKIELDVLAKGKVQVKYFYEKEAHAQGQQDFTVTISLNSVKDRKIKHTTSGTNLALKVPGTRGYTDSASKIAKKDYGIDLNAAHVLADRFMGSGYKDGLNLILTSKEFNQETMLKAENKLTERIEAKMKNNPDQFITFNLEVTATYEVLPDDEIVQVLQKTRKNMSDTEKKKTLEKLQQKQDPRRCEEVFYLAKPFVNGKRKGGVIKAETDHGDKWLDNIFKK